MSEHLHDRPPPPGPRQAKPAASVGNDPTRDEAGFSSADWALRVAVAAMWGSSFLLIDIGVDHFAPELVALLRVAFGAARLAAVPAARCRVPRAAWPAIALLGVVWMAAPFVLFAVAQQSIDSSLAGMLNGAAPLFTPSSPVWSLGNCPAGGERRGLPSASPA